MRILGHALLVAASVTAFCGRAEAAWHQASSTHFVIYSDDKPERLREFATRLEKFDKAVRLARSMQDNPPGLGNRLTVFVVSNIAQVQKLSLAKDKDLAGFYTGRATGSLAFVPRKAGDGSKTDLDPETIFFHEYAHHLMMQDLDRPYPEWMIEGFAEFMSTAIFQKDGSVGLGAPALHRGYSLFAPIQIPLEKLLAGNYGKLSREERASLYARGWLLAHYLTFEPSRQGQLATYLDGIAKGDEPLAAARNAFGDMKELDRNLGGYLNRRRMAYLPIAAARLTIGPIDVRPLSAGAAAILPLRMQSKRGVDDKTAAPLAAQIRAVAAEYPDDLLVQVTLAEAEHDVGNQDAAWAAAERALKADPKSTEAMIYKGRVMMGKAGKSGSDADWKEARRWLLAANKLDTEDPEPLMLFYESYVRQGERPTANAIAALHYASRLAPQDGGLRMTSAMQFLNERKLNEARLEIAPIAYDPHGGEFAAAARQVLDLVSKGDVNGALGIRAAEAKVDEE
jgi:Flp pilus assembly protein TadD